MAATAPITSATVSGLYTACRRSESTSDCSTTMSASRPSECNSTRK
jgi:hypothetical protein